ncbi:MAG: hypothetical protein JWM87_1376 [Candidatus Eremiobacteraeota bacterium]|nr:hypothetical protein [Candidatus Eremiobacteraeota bacterium]
MRSGRPGTAADTDSPVRRYATIAAFEAALKTKLSARVTEHRDIEDLRKHLAFDRVLARLSHIAPDAWLLKGGVALEYQLERARSTTDIGADALSAALEAAASLAEAQPGAEGSGRRTL